MKPTPIRLFSRVAMMLLVMMLTATTAWANDAVTYIDMDGKTQTVTEYTEVTSGMSLSWASGTYVVKSDVTLSGRIRFDHPAVIDLIVCDGKTLTVNGGSDGAFEGNTLNIYAQSSGTGVVNAKKATSCSLLNIAGGKVTLDADGDSYGLYIFDGDDCGLTVNGGDVTIRNNNTSQGAIFFDEEGFVTQNGGKLTVTNNAGNDYNAIQGGGDNTINFNGGTAEINGRIDRCQDINLNSGTADINGGFVDCRNINLNGGNVTVNGEIYNTLGYTVTYGFTSATDSYYIQSFGSVKTGFTRTVKIASGKVFAYTSDSGTRTFLGPGEVTLTADEVSAIAGKTLVPQPQFQYIDENGNEKSIYEYTVLTAEMAANVLPGGWYVLENSDPNYTDLYLTNTLWFNGNVNLILADGADMGVVVEKGDAINVAGKLTVYGQSNQTGTLYASGSGNGINAENGIVVNGGCVKAYGGEYKYGFNGGEKGVDIHLKHYNSYILGSSYREPVTVSGLALHGQDNNGIYEGDLDKAQIENMAYQYQLLEPCYVVKFDKDNNTDPEFLAATFNKEGVAHVAKPEVPTREGYTFLEWVDKPQAEYTSGVIRKRFDFTAPVKQNTYVYAKWWKNDPVQYVAYDPDEGKVVTKTVEDYTVLTPWTDVSKGLPAEWYIVVNSNEDEEDDEAVDLRFTKQLDFNSETTHIILMDDAQMVVGDDMNSAIHANVLNIYGQSIGSGKLVVNSDSWAIEAGSFNIYGGIVHAFGKLVGIYSSNTAHLYGGYVYVANGNYGIYVNKGDLILDWTRKDDGYNINGYAFFDGGSVVVADGKYFTDGEGNYYYGTLTDDETSAIAGKTLSPATQTEYIQAHFSVNGDGTEYTIHTATGWNLFCDALQDNTTYNRFSGKTVKLDADITVTSMAGSDSHDFCGTFDGQGNTLTVNYTTDENDAAPFRYVEDGCVIENLRVCGTIQTSAKFAAGLIAHQYGNVTIRNCRSSVTIKSSVSSENGDGTHGGFVAENHSTADITFEGCLFDGKLLTTGSTTTTRCGGFVGWRSNNEGAVITVTNSLYAPTALEVGEMWVSSTESATFVRNGIASDITNSYYTSDFNDGSSFTGQGKAPRTVTGGTNVTVSDIALTGDETEYNVSGITAYSNGGLALDNGATLYYGSGDVVSLTLSNSATGAPLGYQYGYSASAGTLSGSANPYTLTMPDEDVTITATLTAFPWSGTGEVDSPYVIEYPSQLDLLATNVNGGNDYVNTYFVLGADITYTHKADNEEGADTENNYTAIGYYDGSNYYDFKGHFDGRGHTVSGIRINKDGSDKTDQCQGLFGCTDGATIQNITLADTRITGYHCTGGIVGYSEGTVSDCHVTADVTIHAVQSNANSHGGIVGYNEGTISNCTSAATLTTTSGGSGYGGIAGNNDGTLSNNLAIGAVVPSASWSYYGAICGGNYNKLRHNYYYGCTAMGCHNDNVTTNNGAVPGIVLYDNSSKTDINSYILTTVGNEEVSRVFLSGRTLYKDGNWNTLCLPFNHGKTGPLADATIMELDTEGKYRYDGEKWEIDAANGTQKTGFDAADGTLYLFFKTAESIEAGKPYIIKWEGASGDIDSPIFSNVTVSSATSGVTSSDGKVVFKGGYGPVTWNTETKSILFLGDENKLYYPEAGASLGACRAYFQLNGINANVREFNLNFDEQGTQTTGIIGHTEITETTERADAEWYTINGVRLSAKPTAKGLYVHGGRKVVIK